MTRDDPVPLRDALDAVQRDLGAPSIDAFAVIETAWSDVSGPDMAPHTRVRSVHNDECTIEVDGAVWATRARYLAGDLCRLANDRFGRPVVASVKVVVLPPRRTG